MGRSALAHKIVGKLPDKSVAEIGLSICIGMCSELSAIQCSFM